MKCRGVTRTEFEAGLVVAMLGSGVPSQHSGTFLAALVRAGYLRECSTHPGYLLRTRKTALHLAARLNLKE